VGGVLVAVAAAAVVLWVGARDEGGTGDEPELPVGALAASDFEYSAEHVTVEAGDVFTFENRGPSHHTITADDGRFDSGVVEPGDTFTVTLDGPRDIEVHCEVHPRMKALITVTAP
jgi:plastocyanin